MTEQSPVPLSVAHCRRLLIAEQKTIKAVIAQVGRRHWLHPAELEELASNVALKLIENNYLVLRKFRGRSTLRTYLTVVVHRVYLDWRVAEWGKWRPSAAATRIGQAGVLLEQFMAQRGLTFDQACDLLETIPGVTVCRPALETLATRLSTRTKLQVVPLEDVGDITAGEASTAFECPKSPLAAERVMAAVMRELDALPPSDSRLIRRKFFEGHTVATVARNDAQEPKRLYRHVSRLLKQLRRRLEERGISSADAREVFQDL